MSLTKRRKDWRAEFERESAQVKEGRTLIVGSHVYPGRQDARGRYREAVGVDMIAGPGVDMVVDLEKPLPRMGTFEHVECCSVLEHSRAPWLLAANLERLMNPGATIVLSVPWVWRFHGYPSDYWRFTPASLPVLFPGIRWKAIRVATDTGFREQHLPAYEMGDVVAFGRSEVFGFGFRCES